MEGIEEQMKEIMDRQLEEPTTVITLLPLLVEAQVLTSIQAEHIKEGDTDEDCVSRLAALSKEWSAETAELYLSTLSHSLEQTREQERTSSNVSTRQCDVDSEEYDTNPKINTTLFEHTEPTKNISSPPGKLVKKDSKTKDLGAALGAMANITMTIPGTMDTEENSNKSLIEKEQSDQCMKDQSELPKSPSNSGIVIKSPKIETVLGAMANIGMGITEVNPNFDFSDRSGERKGAQREPPVKKESRGKVTKKTRRPSIVETVLGAAANVTLSVAEGSRSKKEDTDKTMVEKFRNIFGSLATMHYGIACGLKNEDANPPDVIVTGTSGEESVKSLK